MSSTAFVEILCSTLFFFAFVRDNDVLYCCNFPQYMSLFSTAHASPSVKMLCTVSSNLSLSCLFYSLSSAIILFQSVRLSFQKQSQRIFSYLCLRTSKSNIGFFLPMKAYISSISITAPHSTCSFLFSASCPNFLIQLITVTWQISKSLAIDLNPFPSRYNFSAKSLTDCGLPLCCTENVIPQSSQPYRCLPIDVLPRFDSLFKLHFGQFIVFKIGCSNLLFKHKFTNAKTLSLMVLPVELIFSRLLRCEVKSFLCLFHLQNIICISDE